MGETWAARQLTSLRLGAMCLFDRWTLEPARWVPRIASTGSYPGRSCRQAGGWSACRRTVAERGLRRSFMPLAYGVCHGREIDHGIRPRTLASFIWQNEHGPASGTLGPASRPGSQIWGAGGHILWAEFTSNGHRDLRIFGIASRIELPLVPPAVYADLADRLVADSAIGQTQLNTITRARGGHGWARGCMAATF